MDLPAIALHCLRALLLVAGLLVPGAVLMRALRLPVSLGLAFAGSAVLLYTTALALNFAHVPMSLASLEVAIALVTLALGLVARRQPSGINPTGGNTPPWHAPFTRLGGLAPFVAIYWVVVGLMLLREPLAGPDTGFRWAYLPELWLRQGNLDFYPPLSAQDFISYFWAESIPPGVASLHAWAFACGGSFSPHWIALVTALQFLVLHDLGWRIGHELGGDRAARAAVALMAACPLLLWATRMAQETGLTTVAALGLAYALLRARAKPEVAWAAVAGIFAALGAVTREYGLVYPLFATVALACLRPRRAAWVAFGLAAVPVALAWPIHATLRTGNPFYSLDLGGRVPVNAVFNTWVHDTGRVMAHAFFSGGWWDTLRWLGLAAVPAVVGWAAMMAALRRRREALLGIGAVAVFFALWVTSVPYTVGGPLYALRVVSPALALGAVVAGVVLARMPALVLGSALVGTLFMPQPMLRTPLGDWAARREPPQKSDAAAPDAMVPAILAQHVPVVLTDSPGFQKVLYDRGVAAIPLWSPQVAWLFDPRTTPAEAARRWQASGLRVIVLSKYAPAIAFLNQHARWTTPPFSIRPVAESDIFVVLAVEVSPH